MKIQARHAARAGDRRPNLFTYSAVWGYRPPALRKDYPHWDWRAFAEMNGEISNKVQMAGTRMPGTGAHQIFLGPTVLGAYKNYAIEGGLQFPVFRAVTEQGFTPKSARVIANGDLVKVGNGFQFKVGGNGDVLAVAQTPDAVWEKQVGTNVTVTGLIAAPTNAKDAGSIQITNLSKQATTSTK